MDPIKIAARAALVVAAVFGILLLYSVGATILIRATGAPVHPWCWPTPNEPEQCG